MNVKIFEHIKGLEKIFFYKILQQIKLITIIFKIFHKY